MTKKRVQGQLERGSAALEMAAIIPLVALILSAILAMGPFIHMSFATRQASYDCAIAAAQSLDAAQGLMQGQTAGRLSYESFGLPPGAAQIGVIGNWERDGLIQCRVTYNIPIGAFPMKLSVPLPDSYTYTTTVPVQIWKSEWR